MSARELISAGRAISELGELPQTFASYLVLICGPAVLPSDLEQKADPLKQN